MSRAAMVVFCATALAAQAAPAPCPAAKPLGGHVELRITHSELAFTRDSRVRVWFELPPDPYVAEAYKLSSLRSAKQMIWRTTATACRDAPSFGVCGCPASRASGTADLNRGGYATFDPTDPELALLFPDEIQNSADVRGQCVDRGNEVAEMGAILSLPATFKVEPRGHSNSTGVLTVDPSGCNDAGGAVKPECAKEPGRFAVIPFAGSGTIPDDGSGSGTTGARWEVCCGCGIPPREGVEGESDTCGDSAEYRGRFQVAIDAAKALRGNLRPRIERYKQEMRLAEQYRTDFELVSTSCERWDIALTLVKFLLGGEGAPESAQTLVEILDALEKVLDEDPSVLLNVTEGLLPGSLDFTFMGADDLSVGSLFDSVSEVYEGALEASVAGSIPQMKQRLEDCSDVPLISHLVYDDAKLHLRHLEAGVRELPAIDQLSTRIEQADTEVYNKWVAYHDACLEEAQCRGTDPARCGPTPP